MTLSKEISEERESDWASEYSVGGMLLGWAARVAKLEAVATVAQKYRRAEARTFNDGDPYGHIGKEVKEWSEARIKLDEALKELERI
jgi:hypothetical protein